MSLSFNGLGLLAPGTELQFWAGYVSIRLVLAPKTLTCVGWVEERNPTNRENVGFRKASTQPTILVNTLTRVGWVEERNPTNR
ncbi:MAG: hypothetical protein DSM106950_22410 [Stigonema ocellatum SAG 48.90 = DSM 106950]|nr:hypothetical protein [Stigonema ocellatum SAG 48.90 = DSM 106950]